MLAVPLFGLRLGFADEGNYPESTTTRRAYDLVAEGFGPGYNGRLVLAAEMVEGIDEASLTAITGALDDDPGVALAMGPIMNDPQAPTAVLWQVVPATAPQDSQTSDLVHRLRDEVLPPVVAGTGLDVSVAGPVAMNVDFTDYLGERLPIFFAAVLLLSFLLLMVVFRSLLVPATMELLGDRNWWMPRWLGRVLPTIDVEGEGGNTETIGTAGSHSAAEESTLESV
ncbi:MAG: MMPL family transporter [Acidimicrobiales bacterium]|nr:MMPL family transporter [Acidimicrobiales bacterium]